MLKALVLFVQINKLNNHLNVRNDYGPKVHNLEPALDEKKAC